MATPNCPYCGEQAKLMPSAEFYASGIDYGLLYVCLPCDARIGVRTETAHLPEPEPSGLMANAELRFAKKKAHSAFDLLWRRELMSRASAYKWLAAEMQIPLKSVTLQCLMSLDVNLLRLYLMPNLLSFNLKK